MELNGALGLASSEPREDVQVIALKADPHWISLGGLLTLDIPRVDIAGYSALAERTRDWYCSLDSARFGVPFAPSHPPRRLSDLQHGYTTATRILRAAGLPSEHP